LHRKTTESLGYPVVLSS